MTRGARAGAGVLILLCGVGQAVKAPRLTYPFDAWTMYSESPPLVFFAFEMWSDGRWNRFPGETAPFASPGPLKGYSSLNPILTRLLQFQAQCRCESGDARIDAMAFALVSSAHYTRPGSPIYFRIIENRLNTRFETVRAEVLYSSAARIR